MKKALLIVVTAAILLLINGCTQPNEKQKDYVGHSDCKPEAELDAESYSGPLTDTHYHIPHFDNPPPWARNNITPLLGDNIKVADIACTLKKENTTKAFAFFPAFPEQAEEYLQIAKKASESYPTELVPFIMPPDRDNDPEGFPTVDAEELREMLSAYPGLFKGYGEIGLYARRNGAAELPPDSQRLLDIYPAIREHKLIAYFHLGEGQKESFEKALEQNPDINFIWHGDQLIKYENGKQNLEKVDEILSNHPNAFYTIDELYGDRWMIHPDVTKKEFLEYLQDRETLLEKDLETWKEIIERHPDQFMWGTDRSDQVLWSHDAEVGKALTAHARAFIAQLDPSVQEKFAWKNAERLLADARMP